jgi:hypothetical protein
MRAVNRIKDWLHERKINKITKAYRKAVKQKNLSESKILWLQLQKAISSRSSSQIKRMERPMGVNCG